MKHIIKILLCLTLLVFSRAGYGIFNPQKMLVRNVHLKNGLSQCVVTDIVQDKRGFIWIATFDGLNRFDGTRIKVFRHDPQDPSSIISSKIFSVVADENDHLYLFTNDGFCVFDCKTERYSNRQF